MIGTLYRIVNEPVPQPEHAGWLTPLIGQLMRHDPSSRWDSTRAAAYLAGGPDGGLATQTMAPAEVPPGPLPVPAVPATEPTSVIRREPSGRARAVPTPPPGAPRGPDRDRPGRGDRAAVRRVPGPRHEQRRWAGGRSGLGHSPRAAARHQRTATARRPAPRPRPRRPPTRGSPRSSRATSRPRRRTRQATFAQLTPEFQDQSGGLDGYSGFWDTIATATPSNIEPDADNLTVSYDVAYVRDDGGHSNDSVSPGPRLPGREVPDRRGVLSAAGGDVRFPHTCPATAPDRRDPVQFRDKCGEPTPPLARSPPRRDRRCGPARRSRPGRPRPCRHRSGRSAPTSR